MEKYSQISYEPQTASIGIWGNPGLKGEPFSLMRSDIEANILNLAYKIPFLCVVLPIRWGCPVHMWSQLLTLWSRES